MKISGPSFLALAFAGAVILCGIDAAGSSKSSAPATASEPQSRFEIAVIDKSMTGAWEGEREFHNLVRDTFGVTKVLRFEFRSDSFLDWLEQQSPPSAKIICLIDGWTSREITRVDVRGSRGGDTLKRTFKVDHGDWRAALARAKAYAEGPN